MLSDKLTKAGLEFRAVVNNDEQQWWYHLTLVMTSCIIPWYGGVNYIEVRLVYVSDVVCWLDEDTPTGFTTVVGSAIATLAQRRSAGLGLAPEQNQPSPLYIIMIIIDY